MALFNLLAAILAVVIPTPSPAAERQIPTIVTVISSPYCNSLANHFNGALMPMLANDRTLDGVSVQLDDLNVLFKQPDYVQSFVNVRTTIGRQETVLNDSMQMIQRQIVALREGARLSTDAQATAQLTQASWELQAAYDHQRQLSIDLSNLHQSMMRYNIFRANPALGGFDEREMTEPAEMRDVKSYLNFNRQRTVIDQNEDQAVDLAYKTAENYCVPKK
jgi:hypothetical protein